MARLHPRKFDPPTPYATSIQLSINTEEAPVTKTLVLSDVIAKVMYLSFAVAAIVFVSMLLMADVHF
jgi:hypothetical protein